MIRPIAVGNLRNREGLTDSLVRIFELERAITGQTHAYYANFAIRIGQSLEDHITDLLFHLRQVSAILSDAIHP